MIWLFTLCLHWDKELHRGTSCAGFQCFSLCFSHHPAALDASQCKILQLFCPLPSPPFLYPLSPFQRIFHLNENPASVFCSAQRGEGSDWSESLTRRTNACTPPAYHPAPRAPLRLLAWRAIGRLGGARRDIKACPVCSTSVLKRVRLSQDSVCVRVCVREGVCVCFSVSGCFCSWEADDRRLLPISYLDFHLFWTPYRTERLCCWATGWLFVRDHSWTDRRRLNRHCDRDHKGCRVAGIVAGCFTRPVFEIKSSHQISYTGADRWPRSTA